VMHRTRLGAPALPEIGIFDAHVGQGRLARLAALAPHPSRRPCCARAPQDDGIAHRARMILVSSRCAFSTPWLVFHQWMVTSVNLTPLAVSSATFLPACDPG